MKIAAYTIFTYCLLFTLGITQLKAQIKWEVGLKTGLFRPGFVSEEIERLKFANATVERPFSTKHELNLNALSEINRKTFWHFTFHAAYFNCGYDVSKSDRLNPIKSIEQNVSLNYLNYGVSAGIKHQLGEKWFIAYQAGYQLLHLVSYRHTANVIYNNGFSGQIIINNDGIFGNVQSTMSDWLYKRFAHGAQLRLQTGVQLHSRVAIVLGIDAQYIFTNIENHEPIIHTGIGQITTENRLQDYYLTIIATNSQNSIGFVNRYKRARMYMLSNFLSIGLNFKIN